ncbi:MAG TPA: hypothetical protein VII52_06695 [Gemmatimonadaceae bacterium]
MPYLSLLPHTLTRFGLTVGLLEVRRQLAVVREALSALPWNGISDSERVGARALGVRRLSEEV